MASANSETAPSRRTSVKIVVAGGFGVGKTTLVGAVSEIEPLNTEAWMTQASEHVDPIQAGDGKTTTTVAMDFGRRTIAEDLVLYLFGTPGQPRFWGIWDDLCRGASAAVVLVDTRPGRLEVSFPAVNYFERDSDVPFVVAVNRWNGQRTHDLGEVREALRLPEHFPLIECDARDPASARRTLVAALEYTVHTTSRSGVPGAGSHLLEA